MNEVATWTDPQIALIRKTVAKDCNADEFDLFVSVCRSTGLNPFRKQICAIVFNKGDEDRRKMQIITQIDGLRSLAEGTGNYRPDPHEAVITYRDELKSDTNPLGIEKASVTVWKWSHGEWFAVNGTSHWKEFVPLAPKMRKEQRGQKEVWVATGEFWPLDKGSNWYRMPHVMISKCAEAQGLRRGFPVCAGVYAEEEMDQARAREMGEMASERAERAERQARLEATGAKDAVMFSLGGPTDPLELIPLGQVFDRVASLLPTFSKPEELRDWQIRNTHPLREFWSRAPGDGLELKKLMEERMDGLAAIALQRASENAA